MFDDAMFWAIAEDDTAGVTRQEEGAGEAAMGRKRSRCRSVSRNLAWDMEVYTGMVGREGEQQRWRRKEEKDKGSRKS